MSFRQTRMEEQKFYKRLWKSFQHMLDLVGQASTVEAIVKAMNDFTVSPEMSAYIDRSISGMVTYRRTDSARSWREAAMTSGKGRAIYDALMHEMNGAVGAKVEELVRDNARYIKSLPPAWTQQVTYRVMEWTQKGLRPEEIQRKLQQMIPAHVQSNLKCIARTESAKANAALQEARCTQLGLKAYIWRTCKDERVRSTHAHMEGVLCFFDDPPSPEGNGHYHPGNIYNCRCCMEPVVSTLTLPPTMKVWRNNRIETMTLARIQKEYGPIA